MNAETKELFLLSVRYLVMSFVCCISFFSNAVSVNGEARKVVLVGIDGIHYKTLQRVSTPNFDRLKVSELFTGGVINTKSEQKTSSGPSWATILTGMWAKQHQVTGNNKTLTSKVPSIFDRILQRYPKANIASVVRWDTIYHNLYSDIPFSKQDMVVAVDDETAVMQFIDFLNKQPDFAFLHLDDVDHVGHKFGFGKEYDEAITNADKMLGTIISHIENENIFDDKYLLIVTTDHGRNESGKGHGQQSSSERTIFYATNSSYYHGSNTLKTPNLGVPQTYVARSIFDYLDIPLKDYEENLDK